jgi:hypothetical protein
MASEKYITELAGHLASALTAANIEIDPAAVRSAVASAVRENGWGLHTVRVRREMVAYDDKPLRRAARAVLGTDDLRRNA